MKTRRAKSRKTRKQKIRKQRTRKQSLRNRYARGPPNLYLDLSMKDKIPIVLDKLKNDKRTYLDTKMIDPKLKQPLKMNPDRWNKLTAWNASQVLIQGANQPDMQNIIYMLEHDDLGVRTKNKTIWERHILENIFGDLLIRGTGDPQGYPKIKPPSQANISLRQISIILLEHRLNVHEWNEKQKRPPPPLPPPPPPPPPDMFKQNNNVVEDWESLEPNTLEEAENQAPALSKEFRAEEIPLE